MKLAIVALMKLAIVAVLFGSAAAFAPLACNKQSTTLHASFDSEVGAQKPLGYWDPLNFLLDQDQERFDRLRYVELKHGRIAMLAFLGHVTTSSGYHLSGNLDMSGTTFSSVQNGIAGLSQVPTAGIIQMIAFVGFLELNVMKDVTGTAEFEGDFRNGYIDFGWDKFSDDEKLKKRGIELNNGRAAMMGILGLMVHEMLPGDTYVLNAVFGYPST